MEKQTTKRPGPQQDDPGKACPWLTERRLFALVWAAPVVAALLRFVGGEG